MRKLWSVIGLPLLVACAGSSTEVRDSQLGSVRRNEAKIVCCADCGIEAPSRVTYQDTAGGAALVFATRYGEADIMRAHLSTLARARRPPGDRLALISVPHRTYSDVSPDGALLVMVPTRFNDLDALRRQVQAEALRLAKIRCH